MRINRRTKRAGISELMGSLLMIGITLVAGVAVYGWVATQAGVSENAYGKQVSNNVNYLSEHFVVVTQAFAGTGAGGACAGGPPHQCNTASFWLYNNGGLGFTLLTLQVRNASDTGPTGLSSCSGQPGTVSCPLNVLYYALSNSACSAPPNQSCGYIAYRDYAGTSVYCSSNNAGSSSNENGFFQGNGNPPSSLSQNQLSSSPYVISLPSTTSIPACGSNLYLLSGVTYTFTFTGLFGNVVLSTVAVTG
jgi:flagellin-like protein